MQLSIRKPSFLTSRQFRENIVLAQSDTIRVFEHTPKTL